MVGYLFVILRFDILSKLYACSLIRTLISISVLHRKYLS